MQKLVTGLAAASALTFFFSAAQACDLHDVQAMASSAPVEQGVAISTHDGMLPPPPVEDETAQASAAPACEEGENCTPSQE